MPGTARGLSLDDVAVLMADLDAVDEGARHGNRTWFVGGRAFAWVRPFSKADIRRFGGQPIPSGPILAVRLADLGAKGAVLDAQHDGVFTIPHFDGYPAVLVQLDLARAATVRDLVTQAWWSLARPR